MKKLFVILLLIAGYFLFAVSPSAADECDNPSALSNTEAIQLCIDKTRGILSAIATANKNNKNTLSQMEKDLAQLKKQLVNLTTTLTKKEKDLGQAQANLEFQKDILAKTVRSSYIKGRMTTPFLTILSSKDAGQMMRELGYWQAVARHDREVILSIARQIDNLAAEKASLEKQQNQLASLKKETDREATFLRGEVQKASAYEGQLATQIAQLSARQQEILAARSGQFVASIGDSELADDYNASIKGFRESAPGGSFAVFSFGAYTHRNGMSQYGALGRVKNNGSNYEQLLKYYYPGVQLTKIDNKTITVYGPNSYGQSFNDENYQLEEYLKHIYEVPTSWPKEVLKAQAIAARSYAYSKSRICSGQGCQEFKREENSDDWKNAVKETEGLIMTGGPGGYEYSSTTGGWINGGVGWDTTDGGGGSNFMDKSYEKLAGSPWVYKAWYTQTYRNNSDKCGRSNPWLNSSEMADIVNAALVLAKGSDNEASRITPTSSCWGGNPYSVDELRSIAAKYGGISGASTVSVVQGSGTTNQVTIDGVTMSGADFKKAFNLRAPGRMSIPQWGFAFFNIEKK